MMPHWEAETEVWLHRMLSGLSDQVSAILVNDSKGDHLWNGNIPVLSMREKPQNVPVLTRSLRYLGLQVQKQPGDSQKILTNAIAQPNVKQILCHYGAFATKFMDIWRWNTKPLYIHFHGFDVFFDLRQPDNPEKRVHSDVYLEDLKALERSATFIAGSNFLKSQLVAGGIKPENVHVKYYGVPVPEKRKLFSQTNEVQILHLGRFVDFKSPDRTITAFEIARSRGLQGRLVMVGDGPLKPACELQRIRSPYRDSIQMIGTISAAAAQEVYFQSDIYTQHNIQGEISRQEEGFGVSIVEAMAAGLPIVGTRSGGGVETIVDGETGFLNDPGDVEAQAEAFLQLANAPELRQRMGDAGRRRVAEHFSPEQEKDRLMQIMGSQNQHSYFP